MAEKKVKKKTYKEQMVDVGINFDRPDGYVKTGLQNLDMFLSGEIEGTTDIGIPRGKAIIVSGDSGIGKSTLWLDISRRICRAGGRVLFFDHELGLNPKSLESYGLMEFVRNGKFIVVNPVSYSADLDFIESAIAEFGSGGIDLVIIDSLRAIIPQNMLDNHEQVETLPIGAQAKIESFFLNIIKSMLAKIGAPIVYINQMRMKSIGFKFVKGEAGGEAAKYFVDIRLVAKEHEKIERDIVDVTGEKVKKHVGTWIQLFSKKSRFGNTFSTILLPLIFGQGISMVMYYTDFLERGGYADLKRGWKTIEIPDIGMSYKDQDVDGIYKFVQTNLTAIESFVLSKGLIAIDNIPMDHVDADLREMLEADDEREKLKGVPRGRKQQASED